jgi:hypothetical protein
MSWRAVAPAAVACAALACTACTSSRDIAAYPLYPNRETRVLTRDQIARLFGPIASVDGRDVSRLGGAFEVLPGCHVVRTRADQVESTSYVTVIGRPGGRVFALRTKPGYTYIVKREVSDRFGSMYLRADTFAQELSETGAETSVIHPADSPDELAACERETPAR